MRLLERLFFPLVVAYNQQAYHPSKASQEYRDLIAKSVAKGREYGKAAAAQAQDRADKSETRLQAPRPPIQAYQARVA
jgi:hypothetical protein